MSEKRNETDFCRSGDGSAVYKERETMRPLIKKAARMLTDCLDASAGLVKMDENRPDYKMLYF